MMYFTSSLSIISPKNRAWKKLVDWIRRFEHVLILDECSLDALKMEIEAKDCLRIVRNLRYLAQHISSFKKPINHG